MGSHAWKKYAVDRPLAHEGHKSNCVICEPEVKLYTLSALVRPALIVH